MTRYQLNVPRSFYDRHYIKKKRWIRRGSFHFFDMFLVEAKLLREHLLNTYLSIETPTCRTLHWPITNVTKKIYISRSNRRHTRIFYEQNSRWKYIPRWYRLFPAFVTHSAAIIFPRLWVPRYSRWHSKWRKKNVPPEKIVACVHSLCKMKMERSARR